MGVDLEEGETKDVNIWAFPEAVREYTNKITMTVSTPGCVNPSPIEFPIACYGVEPTVTFEGPWVEAIAAAEVCWFPSF